MIHFRNPSVLPIEAITTLGISAKEGDTPIGRFGTGLKYTIAGVLRLGEEISISVGSIHYYFHAEPATVRGKQFQIAHMTTLKEGSQTDIPLGFTTDLGKHWEPWMYIRELWSNCKDENGTHGTGAVIPSTSEETVVLLKGKVVETAYKNLDSFILDSIPVESFEEIENHGVSNGDRTVYYQNIKVGECPVPAMFRYNLKGEFDLTEDRTIKNWNSAFHRMQSALLQSKDRGILQKFFLAMPEIGFAEWSSAPYYGGLGPHAVEVLKELWERVPHKLHPAAHRIAAHLFRPDRSSMKFELTLVEKSKFDRALAFIQKLGFDKEVDWGFVNPDDAELFGFVENENIYICRAAFHNGTQFLAQTMIEEYLHHVEGAYDYTRSFQDILLRRLVALGEEFLGESL